MRPEDAEAAVDRAVQVVADDAEAKLEAGALDLAADEDLPVRLERNRMRHREGAEVVRDPAARAE